LLITQRFHKDHLGGLWEFPGGKREEPESFEECLRRELREELGIEIEAVELLDSITHAYPEKTVLLKFFRCRWQAGEPQALGCQAFAWITRDDIEKYSFPAADEKMLGLLRSEAGFWQ
jgi:mutator protein MutT